MGQDRLDFRAIRRRFRTPLRTGSGVVESVDRVLLRATKSDGTVGYGEVAPWPGFATESAERALEVLRACQGDIAQLRAATRTRTLPCLVSALSMIDHWEAIARFDGARACAGLLPAGSGPDAAAALAAKGWTTLKLKVDPATSIETARAILAATPPSVGLRLDANGSLTLVPARAWVEFARSEPRVEFVEQPLPVDHAGYVSIGPEKVAHDESFVQARGDTRWEGLVVAKPSLLGDWDGFLASGVGAERVIVSSCFETAIGRQAGLWFASQVGGARAVGFDTLGWFEADGRDRHEAGPIARGRPDIDWARFWEDAA